MAKNNRRVGDRKEGRKLRSLEPMNVVSAYIMPDRVGSSNMFRDTLDITTVEKYIHKKRTEGLKGFGMLHLIVSAYVRTVSQRPGINRFIAGQKVYARNDIVMALTIKKGIRLNSDETVIKARFEPTDTAEEVYNKLSKIIEENLAEGDNSAFDGAARVLKHIPGVVLKFVVWLLKLLDYFDLLPKFLLELSPFHGSMFITSMGSLGIPPIFHHLYDFGNLPIFMAYGAKYSKYELNEKGDMVKKKYVDFSVNTDERICDGHYFASAFKYLKEILSNPDVLDVPPESVVEDIE